MTKVSEWRRHALLAMLLTLTACNASTPVRTPPPLLRDGELPVPADYRQWPYFLDEVQRPDLGQIREIFINPLGATTGLSGRFPLGTQIVMELHSARKRPDGRLLTDDQGLLVKDQLIGFQVMAKGEGWGQAAPAGLATGDWIYSAFRADGRTPTGESLEECRRCHIPLESADYIHRYDEYFVRRAAANRKRR